MRMNAKLFDHLSLVAAFLCVAVLVLAGPLLVGTFGAGDGPAVEVTPEEATVGVAVVLRAIARRLVRTGMRDLLQTTVGVVTRTTMRAITRRLARVAVKSQARVFKRMIAARMGAKKEEKAASTEQALSAVFLGFSGLSLSLWGVLRLLEPGQLTVIVGDISLPVAALLGALPLLAHAVLAQHAAWRYGAKASFRTGLDGALIQAYFAGAGSYLPLIMDIEYRGTVENRAKASGFVLGGLFGMHLALNLLGRWNGSPYILFASSMFLIYCFVYAFPIKPLEGHYIWRKSKVLWLAGWIPLLITFLFNIPESFNELL